MNEAQRNTLHIELVMSSLDNTLTEARYNELLDALLPTLTVPDSAAMLKGFGDAQWRERRAAREHSRVQSTASAA